MARKLCPTSCARPVALHQAIQLRAIHHPLELVIGREHQHDVVFLDAERGQISFVLDEIDDLLLPYTLDLSVFEQLGNAELRAHIERVGQIFYERADGKGGEGTLAP